MIFSSFALQFLTCKVYRGNIKEFFFASFVPLRFSFDLQTFTIQADALLSVVSHLNSYKDWLWHTYSV
jgi:hypothetical protein